MSGAPHTSCQLQPRGAVGGADVRVTLVRIMVEGRAKRKCEACKAEAPSTETEYTLIGSKHAWRCKKTTVEGDPQPKLVWYCPSCWRSASRK